MAKVRQRTWTIPGQRTKRKAWGYVTVENGKQIRQFKSAPPEPKEKEQKPLTPEQRRSEEIKKAREPRVPKEAGLNRFAWNSI